MIGNDIVDLKQAALDSPESHPESLRHQRFLDKLFTKKEQTLIFYSKNKQCMIWLLWSMKEAAYKVNIQQFGKPFYNPKRLICNIVSLKKGTVTVNDKVYFTSSKITRNYIYTVATLTKENNYKSKCFKNETTEYKLQSEILKKQFLQTVSKTNGYNLKKIKIKKSHVGVPKIYNDLKKLPIAFSLTHCGNFSGFAYL